VAELRDILADKASTQFVDFTFARKDEMHQIKSKMDHYVLLEQHTQLKTDVLDKFALWDAHLKEDYYKVQEIDSFFEQAKSSMYETL